MINFTKLRLFFETNGVVNICDYDANVLRNPNTITRRIKKEAYAGNNKGEFTHKGVFVRYVLV